MTELRLSYYNINSILYWNRECHIIAETVLFLKCVWYGYGHLPYDINMCILRDEEVYENSSCEEWQMNKEIMIDKLEKLLG